MDIGAVSYSSDSQWLLNLVLASMILAVALDIRWQDFKAVVRMPKAIGAGLGTQFLLLPALTALLTLWLDLPAGIELGMILVAACPGGAISNYVTYLAGGNAALSISMTATASALAVVMMPLNFLFWSQVNPETAAWMREISVDGGSLLTNLVFVLGLPLVSGLILQRQLPDVARGLHRVLRLTSPLALIAFIAVAVGRNHEAIAAHFWLIFTIVLVHNGLAFALGFLAGRLSRLQGRDIKAITIEVGMQNSSLAVAIVFTQFGGEAGMALISVFWGTWHIISGLLVALGCRYWPDLNNVSVEEATK